MWFLSLSHTHTPSHTRTPAHTHKVPPTILMTWWIPAQLIFFHSTSSKQNSFLAEVINYELTLYFPLESEQFWPLTLGVFWTLLCPSAPAGLAEARECVLSEPVRVCLAPIHWLTRGCRAPGSEDWMTLSSEQLLGASHWCFKLVTGVVSWWSSH